MRVRNIKLKNTDEIRLLSPTIMLVDRHDEGEHLMLSMSGQVIRFAADNSRVGRITVGSRSGASLSLTGGVRTMRILYEALVAARSPKGGPLTDVMTA